MSGCVGVTGYYMPFNHPTPTVIHSPQETADQVAAAVQRWGLRLPVLLTLDAGRPLAFLGAQSLYIATPVLRLLLPQSLINQLAQLLETPVGVNLLIEKLENAHDSMG